MLDGHFTRVAEKCMNNVRQVMVIVGRTFTTQFKEVERELETD